MGKIIALSGGPGSGKSVQAEMVADSHGWTFFSLGQTLRSMNDNAMADTTYVSLVGSDLAKAIWQEAMSGAPEDRDIIMDSFPRKLEEAEWFISKLPEWRREFVGVVNLFVPQKESVRRLLLRGRLDDNETKLRRAFVLYKEATRESLEYCQKNAHLEQVDGVGTVQEVYDRVEDAIKKMMGE